MSYPESSGAGWEGQAQPKQSQVGLIMGKVICMPMLHRAGTQRGKGSTKAKLVHAFLGAKLLLTYKPGYFAPPQCFRIIIHSQRL